MTSRPYARRSPGRSSTNSSVPLPGSTRCGAWRAAASTPRHRGHARGPVRRHHPVAHRPHHPVARLPGRHRAPALTGRPLARGGSGTRRVRSRSAYATASARRRERLTTHRPSPVGDMRAHLALLVPARNAVADRRPEGGRVAEVAAEGVPGQSGTLSPQRGQPRGSQAAPLEHLGCVGVLDPREAAATADAVVDGERVVFLALQVGRALAPPIVSCHGEVSRGGSANPFRRPYRPRLARRSSSRHHQPPSTRRTSCARPANHRAAARFSSWLVIPLTVPTPLSNTAVNAVSMLPAPGPRLSPARAPRSLARRTAPSAPTRASGALP